MLLVRASLRHLVMHWAQCAMAIAGIALGVAIVVGMQAAQDSARRAFDASLTSVFGAATHHVVSVDGEFSEVVLATVRRAAAPLRPTPAVLGSVRFGDADRRVSLRLAGIDPITAGGGRAVPGFDVRAFMRDPGTVVLNSATAKRLEVAEGSRFAVETPTGQAALVVLDVVPPDAHGNAAFVGDQALVSDIATAQEVLGMAGLLSRIELDTTGIDDAPAVLRTLRERLPADLMVVESGRAAHGARAMTRAFYTNLDALSLLAVLVGGFMIYNTVSFLVVQRHRLFARLRALGVTRAGIARLVAFEAIALGTVGGVLGIAFGHGVAGLLMSSVTRSMRDHYFDPGTVDVVFSPLLAAGAVLLALVVTLSAALVPAWQAARAEPVEATRRAHAESTAVRGLARAELAGFVIAIGGVVLLLGSARSLVAGFGALGCFILAAMLVVPRNIQRLLALLELRAGLRLPLPERLAVRAASRSMGRIGMAVAALMAATATSIGVGIMVASFRVSVNDWLGQLLRAELYVSQSFERHPAPAIDAALVQTVLSVNGVETVSKVRRQIVRKPDGDIRVTAYELPAAARAGFRFLAGDPAQVWRDWAGMDVAIVSEPFAYHHGVAPGDHVVLATPGGEAHFTVSGIYADYGSEHGVLAMSLETFARHWHDRRVHSLGVYSEAGTDAAALRASLESLLAARPELRVWSNAEIRAESMAVFDRTFVVTDVLTLFAALIAALGVFNALMALSLEREREYAVMRATGCGAAVMRRVLYTQTLLAGALAALIAVPVGIGIAMMLIEVINVRSFGWTMSLHWAWRELAGPALLAVIAATAATVIPAERAVRLEPAGALRDE